MTKILTDFVDRESLSILICNPGKQASGKGKQGKSWSESESPITSRRESDDHNGKSKVLSIVGVIQVSKDSGNCETLKMGISSLETFESETSSEDQESAQMGQFCIIETPLIHEGWSHDEQIDEGSCVGWHEDWERLCCISASSFPLESSKRVVYTRQLNF